MRIRGPPGRSVGEDFMWLRDTGPPGGVGLGCGVGHSLARLSSQSGPEIGKVETKQTAAT